MILALHLLIIQATTWVFVALDTLSGPLWVGVANAVLFKGFLHINAARKLAAKHSMQWQKLSLRYLWAPIPLVRLWCTFLPVDLVGRPLWSTGYTFDLCSVHPRIYSSSFLLGLPSTAFLFASYLWDSELDTLTTVYSPSDQPTSSTKAQGPIYKFGPLSLQLLLLLLLLLCEYKNQTKIL